MKKQILAAAVAAVIATPAMADISITGKANFEFFATQATAGDSNKTDTEINLNFRGKSGDSAVVLDVEVDGHDGAGSAIDVENSYLTTKLGPIGFKGGNYASSTSGLLGEIENGGRDTSKFQLDYSMDGIKVYAGNGNEEDVDGNSSINPQMFAGIQATVEGWKLHLKKNNDDKNSFGVSGKAGPVGIRAEMANADADADSGYFVELTADFDGIKVGYAVAEMDANGGIKEDDSSIFSQSSAGKGNSNSQFMASTSVDGTSVYAKMGTIGFDGSQVVNGVTYTEDQDYWEIGASRKLASGATLAVDYSDYDTADNADAQVLEIDVSVKF